MRQVGVSGPRRPASVHGLGSEGTHVTACTINELAGGDLRATVLAQVVGLIEPGSAREAA